jgi:hypothetical protein
MVRFVHSGSRPVAILLAGALLLSLGGCVAALPLGQMAYQAAMAPSKPCETGNCPSSGLGSMWDSLKGGLTAR